MRRTLMKIAALIAAWIPIFFFWTMLAIVYGRMTPAAAASLAATTIGTAAVLGIAIWRFCMATPWPQRLRAGFYAKHLVAAVIYAVAWIAGGFAIEGLVTGKPASWRLVVASPVLGWQLFMGLWLYGVIAGISYAIQMQRRAHENERRALQAEAGLTAARLDALRSRLHPHFLFNALHTVAALVRRDPGQAENAIEKLGEMLRYSLTETRGGTVPFAEEWELTQRYLEFEQLRYGGRLTVASDIGDECATCSTPSFALQTLVENAVRHSIATRPDGGRIEITADADDARLHVHVRDDGGNGLPPAQEGAHFGLPALRERLHAMYGAEARLIIDSGPAGFEVSFTVPRSNTDDE
jgi:two-component system, LytTR family, sensor kinase